MDIRKLLDEMIRRNASDIYITVGVAPTYRIEGNLAASNEYKEVLGREQIQELAFSLLSEGQKDVFTKEHEMNVALSYPGFGRFRANLFHQRNSIRSEERRVGKRVDLG